MKGITPRNDKKFHGYMVRLQRSGHVIQRNFSVAEYGSEEVALSAAQKKLGELLIQFPLQPKPRKKATISRTFHRANGGTGGKMPCYLVTYWGDDAKRHTEAFYFHKYDQPEQARQAARDFADKQNSQDMPRPIAESNDPDMRALTSGSPVHASHR